MLGIAPELLSPGEDASFESHDGMRISARLYRPSPELGYEGARPLVYYVHGGPQSQERPNFAWFSMPLIQALTLNGFAVFVPNVRGSTGYCAEYAQRVDRDWGGNDRLDHVFASTQLRPVACTYHHEWRARGLSDHSALEADLELLGASTTGRPPSSAR